MGIADFERSGMQLALQKLNVLVPSGKVMQAIKTFVDMTDLLGRIFVLKHLSSRKK